MLQRTFYQWDTGVHEFVCTIATVICIVSMAHECSFSTIESCTGDKMDQKGKGISQQAFQCSRGIPYSSTLLVRSCLKHKMARSKHGYSSSCVLSTSGCVTTQLERKLGTCTELVRTDFNCLQQMRMLTCAVNRQNAP